MQRFSSLFPLPFTETLYTRIAEIAGMQAQDMQTLFQNIPTEMQHSVDLSVDDLMEYMDA